MWRGDYRKDSSLILFIHINNYNMFDIKGDKIILNTEDLAIPPFADHFNSSKDKQQALKEIEYIIWLYKWNTPY